MTKTKKTKRGPYKKHDQSAMKMAVEAVQSEGCRSGKLLKNSASINQHYSIEFPVKLKLMPNQGGNLCSPNKWRNG